jgi:GTPase SAR1 family protein
MIPSPKVKKHLSEIKREQWTAEELRELLKAIARDFQIQIEISGEAAEDDFWALSPEEEQHFNDLLDKSTKDIKNKRFTEYSRPQV